MNKLAILCVVAMFLVIFGCGGGGTSTATGSTSSATGTTATGTSATGTTSGIEITQLEGVFSGTKSVANLTELQPGDVIQLELVETNSVTQQQQIIPASSFSTTLLPSYGSLSSTGVLTVTAQTPTSSTVSASDSTGTLTQPVLVGPPGAKVSGLVQESNGTAVPNVEMRFFDTSGDEVGQTVSGVDGTFLANVPVTAVTFSAVTSGLQGFYTEFLYGSLSYSSSLGSCNAPVPTLSLGVTTKLPSTVIVLPVDPNNPPPPPNGCQ